MLRKDDLAIGPSGIDPMTGKKRGEEMSRDRMGNVVNAFAQAAGLARVLGFDAVEICGGQGGLIDQFLRPETNHRSDEYGGSLLARTRFASDVLHAVRKMVGRKFPIIFRLSLLLPENPDSRLVHTPEELSELLAPLCNAGVDIFAVDDSGTGAPFHGNALGFAGWVKMLSGRPVIIGDDDASANSAHLESLSRRLAAQEFDLIAIGRALLADAEWGRKVREARVNEIHLFQ
jgi:2,4-dienoyl-CoA reductase-like NADH-dependent reductase (Old Yellow Enzyme family)